ncbi:MAG TPA: glutamate--tRNA ligase [Thermoleophilaceae bacterium]|nr:glutamate--tRNA ligase [Thermoleophilaceae bacterium]
MSIRVRFAPSPTGALHIGGARTALFNWLLARGSGGDLVLRIEDTDRERSTEANVEQILDALRWLELDFDEGPIFQSERSDRHRDALQQLLDSGHAYRSNAAAEDVKAWKEQHPGRGFRGEPESDGAIRLRVPDEGTTVVHDVIRGDTRFDHVHIDDLVIARGDGSVLYNFAVAIDDLDAGITHVVRGEDHLSNTPKQLLVLEALDAEPPTYAHLPLLHGPDGKKLSKRHGAASVQELRDAGYLPEAVRNYIALLGWSLDDSTTLMTTEQMVESFDLARVSRSPAVFDEQKLRWMNGRYLRELEPAELARRLEQRLGRGGLEQAAALAQDKLQTLDEFWPLAGFLVERQPYDEKAWAKVMDDGSHDRLAAARAALAQVDPFDDAGVEAALRAVVERLDVKPREVFQPVRLAISGSTISPGIFESVVALGRDETLARVDDALARS